MSILGWKVSAKETKRLPFDIRFNPLGVVVDLCESCKGVIIVHNKESRVKSIVEECNSILKMDELHPLAHDPYWEEFPTAKPSALTGSGQQQLKK